MTGEPRVGREALPGRSARTHHPPGSTARDDIRPTERHGMPTVTSPDGITIAYDATGTGEPVIIVGGAFSTRDHFTVTQIAEHLAADFTVINYDRRGRGDSTDSPSYSPGREVEDLIALIDAVGPPAHVLGLSTGAALALEAAVAGGKISKLVLVEPPYVVDDTRGDAPRPTAAQLAEQAATDRDGTVETFMAAMGLPPQAVAGMRTQPMWPALTGLAHTLAYDAALTGDDDAFPADRAATVTTDTLVIDADSSPAWLRNTAATVARTIPHASHHTLTGQDHFTMNPADLAAAVKPFLTATS